ncbi:MAG: HmuY family protein, partial [Candidatus Symbiothrix sp.]|nr:HmuY family protein [Candidatus Symbiothrix sp.]
MNTKITFLLLSLFLMTSLSAQVRTFNLDINGGDYAGSPIPDYTKWYYFSFEQGDTIGTSKAELGTTVGGIGTEVINAEWKARTDWDIAFHAGDVRTNSGLAGNGAAGSLKIADATGDTPTSEVFANLTAAPNATYPEDGILTGTFIFGMTSMPPLRTTQLSASAATNGWAVIGMGGNTEKPTVVVFKTTSGKYVKVHLKKFFDADGKPGFLEFDYETIASETGISTIGTEKIALYPNPVSDVLNVQTPS